MRIGISLNSSHRTNDVRAAARDMIDRAAASRDAGLDSLFVGDHHIMPVPYYQNVPMLARLLAEWGDRPAGCLFLLPLWNPVLLAEQVGTLASIAEGRFILQCGLGTGWDQFAAIGVNMHHRPSLFEDGLAIVRGLLAGRTVNASGRYLVQEARISPIPPEPVEVWIGGGVEPAVDRAARLGDAWLGGPELTFAQAERWIAFYRERCAAHGRTPAAIAIRRDVYLGRDPADATSTVEPILKAGYRGFDEDALVWGDSQSVVQQFERYAALGFTDIIVRHITNEQSSVLKSIAQLARVREQLVAK